MVPLISIIFAVFSLPFLVTSENQQWLQGPLDNFQGCLSAESHPYSKVEHITHTFWSGSYSTILQERVRNLRFNTSQTPKPYYIITPENGQHARGAIICCKRYGLEMRIRGGGHDYEGLSYVSSRPYVLLDMSRLRKIDINVNDQTAWVDAGVTLGELYYHISNKSATLAFPSGVCPTVGVGGHFSGGGQGMLMRKYGLAIDNIIDAVIVNSEGRILDRKTMGDDLFWAIRGGGAASFGVILKWKIRLVPVPPIVTAFSVTRTHEEGANRLVFRWQELIDELPREILIRIMIMPSKTTIGEPSMKAGFHGLYLGKVQELMKILEIDFPELKVKSKDCNEMSWINTTLLFDFYEGEETLKDLLDRNHYRRGYFKGKSDYVTLPIRESMLEAIWDVYKQGIPGTILLQPYGGLLNEIARNQTPFPHRAGTLYNVHYFVLWREDIDNIIKEKMDWLHRIYDFMADYVEKPRTAYQNYRDLDLGKNDYLDERYSEASTWGHMYFKDNFKRLAQIKHQVDPANFFRHEQSIPPLRKRYA